MKNLRSGAGSRFRNRAPGNRLPAWVFVAVALTTSLAGQQTRDASPGRATNGTGAIRGVVMSTDGACRSTAS